jgi:hypothetical protein
VAVLLVLAVGLAVAADAVEVKCKIKSVDVEKKIVKVVKDNGKEVEVQFTESGPPYLFGPKSGKVPKGLKDDRIKEGADVILTFETKDGKETCTKFQIAPEKK